MAQSQHPIFTEAAPRGSHDAAVFEASVGRPARAGTDAGPTLALPAQPSAMVEIARVLAGWRAAERELSEHIEASPERTRIRANVASLRARYHQLFHEHLDRRDPPVYVQAQMDVFAWLSPGMLRRN